MLNVDTEGRWRSQSALKPMSSNATDERNEAVSGGEQADRYAELNIGDEEFVIYDRENHQAWIQSSESVTVSEYQ